LEEVVPDESSKDGMSKTTSNQVKEIGVLGRTGHREEGWKKEKTKAWVEKHTALLGW
jgi:hypothetical protein